MGRQLHQWDMSNHVFIQKINIIAKLPLKKYPYPSLSVNAASMEESSQKLLASEGVADDVEETLLVVDEVLDADVEEVWEVLDVVEEALVEDALLVVGLVF